MGKFKILVAIFLYILYRRTKGYTRKINTQNSLNIEIIRKLKDSGGEVEIPNFVWNCIRTELKL